MELRYRARFIILIVLLCIVTMPAVSVAQASAAVKADARLAGVIADIDSTAPGSSGDQLLKIFADLTGADRCGNPVTAVVDGAPYDFGATRWGRWARGPEFGENGITMANEYVKDYFADLGLSVVVQPFLGHDCSLPVGWGKGTPVSGDSLVAELPGTTKPDEIVIVCGHLDSKAPDYSTSLQYPLNFVFSPGADDNLSGAATAMIAAKTLSQFSFARTIRFACWGGEEEGLFGSLAYASRCRTQGENIVAVLNVEMTGYSHDGSDLMEIHTRNIGNGDPDTSQGNGQVDSRIARAFIDVVDAYGIALTPRILDDSQYYSDHKSFWHNSYNAIAIEEQNLKVHNPNYHKPTDTLANMTWPFFTKITGATVATTAHLAQIQ